MESETSNEHQMDHESPSAGEPSPPNEAHESHEPHDSQSTNEPQDSQSKNEPPDSHSTDGTERDKDDPIGERGNCESLPPSRPVNSGVRYYNLQGFYNRVEDDNWDYTVEVLVARPNWAGEVEEETKRRTLIDLDESQPAGDVSRTAGALMASSPEKLGERRKIQRVRIRSPAILKLLADFSSWDDSDLLEATNDTIVFGRPFRTFEYCHAGMKKKLAEMRAAELTVDDGTSQGAEAQQAAVDSSGPSRPTPLDEMQVYVDFVENMILPLWTALEKVEKGSSRSILYSDIPCLFRPGELVYMPPSPAKSRDLYPTAAQTIFKVLFCIPRDLPTSLDGGRWDVTGLSVTSLHLHCLDHNGESFKAIYHLVEFKEFFDGEKEITSLPCYPLRFHSDYEAVLKRHKDMGEWVRQCVEGEIRHFYYSGWTMETSVLPQDEPGNTEAGGKGPSYIESDVVVDFKEATRQNTDWATEGRDRPTFAAGNRGKRDSYCEMMYWSKNGSEITHRCSETFLYREDTVYAADAKEFFRNDRWLQLEENSEKNPSDPAAKWDPSDLALVPRRILAYVLSERRFARLDAQHLQNELLCRQATLDDIKMKPGHRNIIRSTVSSHFDKKERERKSVVPAYQPDVIHGKGRGVVILLHGAPGVGKTATAEAVAQEFKKPLFPITCGDLGTTPVAVEKTLKDIFRYAHLWDCILLLDEADVFLTQRDRTDVERNALVSGEPLIHGLLYNPFRRPDRD
jgi:hypothetical protein